jgi:hypothetical protein
MTTHKTYDECIAIGCPYRDDEKGLACSQVVRTGSMTSRVNLTPAKPPCLQCYGRGVIRHKKTRRYIGCPCGRLPDSWGCKVLGQQAAREERLQTLKRGGKW